MRMTLPHIGYVLAGSALFVLTACSGNGTTGTALLQETDRSAGTTSMSRGTVIIPPNVLPPSMQAQVHITKTRTTFHKVGTCSNVAPVEFVSDYNNNVVYEITFQGAICGTIMGFTNPQGLSDSEHTDKVRGNLYVANTGASDIVEINDNTGAVINTYADANEYPVDVCVAPNGDLAVMNIATTTGGAGNIALYTAADVAPGAPTGTASSPNYTSPRFCAFDHKGQYIVFDNLAANGAASVGKLNPGNYTGAKNITVLTPSNAIAFPGGVAVDNWDDDYDTNPCVIIDDQNAKALYSYSPEFQVFNDLTLQETTPLASASDPVTFAFLEYSKRLLTADAGLDSAQAYFYPAGGNAFNNIALPAGGLPIGTATDPTEQYARVPAPTRGAAEAVCRPS